MSTHCPQDGGFIGAAGCTHPHHAHSPLVKRIINAKTPRLISADNAERALREGFYVDAPNKERVGFGKNLLTHIKKSPHHAQADATARLERLEFAVNTIKSPDVLERNHRDLPNRSLYVKAFKDFGIFAITEKDGLNLEQVYTFFPRRGGRKR